MDVKATLVERVSKKSGNTYTAISIKLTDKIEKLVFLNQAEMELLKLKNNASYK